MSLFQNSVLNKYLNELDSEKVEIAWAKFEAHFHNSDIQENIRNSKEEQYQGEFLIDLFVNVFGYIKNPTQHFNLTTELKNVKGAKKADGAILQNDEAIAVIELKGTDTIDLAKVETQAFGYKNNHPKCLYVITSNFEKLRLYIENAVEFEEFNLFNLDRKRFDLLYLCLSADNLLRNIPKKIKDESISEGEIITKKLYRDYSNFRNEVFSDIVENNPHYDKLTLFRKTQKLQQRNSNFLIYLQSQFPIEKFTQKLQNWHELEFADFINELGKAIKKTSTEKLTKSDEMEWMELFETKKVSAQAIKSEIDATDRKIDEMVYELYGLEEDEIAIVEKSLTCD